MVSKEYLDSLEKLEKEYAKLERQADAAWKILLGCMLLAPFVLFLGLWLASLVG